MATRLRALDPTADRPLLDQLWATTLAPTWPLLPTELDGITQGFVAETRGTPVGAVALHPAGSIQLLLVHPDHRRRGVGTALLDAATSHLAGLGHTAIGLGVPGPDGGDAPYLWPGVPDDLPGAVAFFEARGWNWGATVVDLTRDLRGYRTPEGVHERAAEAGVTFAETGAGEREVLDFEAANFAWLPQYQRPGARAAVARDRTGALVGALLLNRPGQPVRYAPMLGHAPGAIAAVGTADAVQGQGVGSALVAYASEVLRDAGTRTCLIDWTTRERFYGRLGYTRWRGYRMASRGL